MDRYIKENLSEEYMQKFEPDQLVLVKAGGIWHLKRYSFFGAAHETQDGCTWVDDRILPYAGNEHLLGTSNPPTPKWEPKPGELVAVRKDGFDYWVAAQFKCQAGKRFQVTNRSDGLAAAIFDYCEPIRDHFTIPEE